MYHVIVNPNACTGRSKKKLKKAEAIFRENNKDYIVHYTEYPGHATQIARELTQSGERDIVAFGGDGTFNEVLNGLSDPSLVRLGLLPAGTANDFSTFAGIPLNINKAMDLILHTEPKPCDYIVCGGVRSLNSVGTGIDVDVLQRCKASKLLGKVRYWKCLLDSIRHFKGNEFECTVNGETKRYHAFLAVLCNGGMFGGGMKICPDAKVDDNQLDLVIVDYLKGFKKLLAMLALVRGKVLELPATTHMLVEEVNIVPDQCFIIQYDGELYGGIPFQASIQKNGINIYRN
ncbi:MAG: diacylglycerol kinase family lipid kinase [Clostridia bacterium]|nr:diacylglycerol kinase family lipid kinase [Clostridia bacterium]